MKMFEIHQQKKAKYKPTTKPSKQRNDVVTIAINGIT